MSLKGIKKISIISCFVLFGLSLTSGLSYTIPQFFPKTSDSKEFPSITQNDTNFIPIYFDDNKTKNVEGLVITELQTPDVFAIQNQIKYTIIVSPNINDDVQNIQNLKRVVVIFGSPNDDYSYLNTKNIDYFVRTHQMWYADVVDLNIASGFYHTSTITFHTEHDVVMYAVIFRGNNTQPTIGFTKPVITIDSPVAKLEIDSIKEQHRNDNIVLGLTMIIISWIPLDVGFRLRYDVWKSTFTKKDNLETNEWNCDWFPNE